MTIHSLYGKELAVTIEKAGTRVGICVHEHNTDTYSIALDNYIMQFDCKNMSGDEVDVWVKVSGSTYYSYRKIAIFSSSSANTAPDFLTSPPTTLSVTKT